MRQGFVVGLTAFGRELVRALIELLRHLEGFFFGTAQAHQGARQVFQRNHYLYASASGVMRMVFTPTRLVGLLFSPPPLRVVGMSPILPRTSSPFTTWPKAVYCLSRKRASARQMKNWLPAESGCCERAMERTPRTWGLSLNSALIL